MSTIRLLPDTLISQIAAGEVVERPASVVKELLENSLDAGATRCVIEIEQGGLKLILVRDDGCGMRPEDAHMSFARHATSKIATLSDLENIGTFGFRGEALAAIASVAQVTLKTRPPQEESGYEILYEAGKNVREGSCGMPAGTEVVVRNLFFSTPARKKFMKSESTELQHISAIIHHMALANPQVAFEFINNGRNVFSLPPSSSARERMAAILGKDFVKESLPVSFITPSISITGFVGTPNLHASSRRHQYLFVNGRDVQDPLVTRAVIDAYGSRLPGRVYPFFTLHIDLPASDVDVNVHPRKLSVKFAEPQRLYRDLHQAVTQALDAQNLFVRNLAEDSLAASGTALAVHAPSFLGVQDALSFSAKMLGDDGRLHAPIQSDNSAIAQGSSAYPQATPIILGYLANAYILIAGEQGLVLVDQHAAHERIMYEKYRALSAAHEVQSQPLLVPMTFELSTADAPLLALVTLQLAALGFAIEQWSGGTFALSACPTFIDPKKCDRIVRGLIETARSESLTPAAPLNDAMLKSLACRSAVMFGMPLSTQEQSALIAELQITQNKTTCPHGRPTTLVFDFAELEQRFRRRS